MSKTVLGLALGVVFAPVLCAAAEKGDVQKKDLDRDPNLVAWWKFDQGDGEVVKDSSKGRHDGRLMGGLSLARDAVAGKQGKALRFDGKQGFVEIPKYKGVCGTRPRAVAAWIKTKRPRGRIIQWGGEDFGQAWTFGFVRGHVGVTPRGGYLYMNAEIDDDEWHHVGVVVGEAELPNLHDDVVLYLDGEPAEIHDIGLLDLWPVETGEEMDVRIGAGFQGVIDDVRIYDRALSDEEMKALFVKSGGKPQDD